MITDTIPACHLWPPPRTRPNAVQVLRRHREEQDERHAAMTAHLATLVNLPEWLRDES